MFYTTEPIRFECTQCGRCCSGGGDYHVFLSAKEAERIRELLQLSVDWFKRRYLQKLDSGELTVRLNADGRCSFLDAAGQCSVYAARPTQCRTYPFWPELLRSKSAWRAEAARCEGIERGATVPLAQVRAALTAQRAYEAGIE
ncbi:MAG: YkgJ family cysteine cluster protein [Gammaproteobacteria bacterium]|nr:YkgJ family cysteine cluster protein [Gammaproteobacteria bacterium]